MEGDEIVLLNDEFTTSGDSLDWYYIEVNTGNPPSVGYSLTFTGGEMNLTAGVLYENVVKNVDIPIGEDYTISFDVTYLTPSTTFSFGIDGGLTPSSFVNISSTGSYSFDGIGQGGELIEIAALNSGMTVQVDNMKIVYHSPSTQIYLADIRQATDYSPFGVTLENRKFEKEIVRCTEVTDTVTTTVLNEDFTSGGSWTKLGGGTLTYPSGEMKNTKTALTTLPQTIGSYKNFTLNEANNNVSFDITSNTCGVSINVNIKDNTGTIVTSASYPSNGSYSLSFNSITAGTYRIEFYFSTNSPCNFTVDNVVISSQEIETNTVCDTVPANYRYGYNGMEADDEVKGSGNSYTTEFRQLDPRLGRWLSLDPVVKEDLSPYNSMSNNPILMIDPHGDDDYFDSKGNFLRSDDKKTRTIYIVDKKGVEKKITDYMFTKTNGFSLARIGRFYAKEAGVSLRDLKGGMLSVANRFYSSNGSNSQLLSYSESWFNDGSAGYEDVANFNAENNTITLSLTEGKVYETLTDGYNFMNLLVHEKAHKKSDRHDAFEHLDVYLEQVQHFSWAKTTKAWKNHQTANVQDYYNQALNADTSKWTKKQVAQYQKMMKNWEEGFKKAGIDVIKKDESKTK